MVSQPAKVLVTAPLNLDPTARPSIDDIANHNFFKLGYSSKLGYFFKLGYLFKLNYFFRLSYFFELGYFFKLGYFPKSIPQWTVRWSPNGRRPAPTCAPWPPAGRCGRKTTTRLPGGPASASMRAETLSGQRAFRPASRSSPRSYCDRPASTRRTIYHRWAMSMVFMVVLVGTMHGLAKTGDCGQLF